MNQRAIAAEFIGTFTFVAAVCSAAMFSSPAGAGPLGIAFAAGLAVLAMAFAIGHISGGHFNPAVTIGLIAGGRFGTSQALPYIAAQLVGGVLAALMVSAIWGGAPAGSGVPKWHTFAAISNSFGGPGAFSMSAVFIIETVLTAALLIVIMGATSKRAHGGFAPIAIGLAMTLCYMIALPISNASLNPARSTATAVLAGGPALANLWIFWAAPILGGAIGGGLSKWLQNE